MAAVLTSLLVAVVAGWLMATSDQPILLAVLIAAPALLLGVLSMGWSKPLLGVLIVLLPIQQGLTQAAAVSLEQVWSICFLIAGAAFLLQHCERKPLARVGRVLGLVTVIAGMSYAFAEAGTGRPTKWFWIVMVLGTFVTARELARAVDMRDVARLWVVAGGVIVVATLINPYGYAENLRIATGYVSELGGGFLGPHTTATAALAVAPWCIYLGFSGRTGFDRAAGFGMTFAMVGIILLSTVRSAQVGLVLLAVGAVVASIRWMRRRRGWVPILAVSAAAFGGAVIVVNDPSILTRWQEIPLQAHNRGLAWAGSGRLFLWDEALKSYAEGTLDQKLFGSGLTASRIRTGRRVGTEFETHSDPLELLVAAGVVGLAIFAALAAKLLTLLLAARRTLHDHGEVALATLAVAATASFTAAGLLTGFLFWPAASVPGMMFLGFAIGVADRLRSARTIDRAPTVAT